jgi:hypothetical protein
VAMSIGCACTAVSRSTLLTLLRGSRGRASTLPSISKSNKPANNTRFVAKFLRGTAQSAEHTGLRVNYQAMHRDMFRYERMVPDNSHAISHALVHTVEAVQPAFDVDTSELERGQRCTIRLSV